MKPKIQTTNSGFKAEYSEDQFINSIGGISMIAKCNKTDQGDGEMRAIYIIICINTDGQENIYGVYSSEEKADRSLLVAENNNSAFKTSYKYRKEMHFML